MKVVILAAGRGKRMNHLTSETPKPLLNVAGKSLLQHKITALPSDITEVILVVGYLGDKIKEHIGNVYEGRKISYVFQENLNGTMGALFLVKDLVGKESFLVLMGDDLYSEEDLRLMIRHPWAMLASAVRVNMRGARIDSDDRGRLMAIVEASDLSPGMYANAGCYVLRSEIFSYPMVSIANEEYGLPQTIVLASRDVPIQIIPARNWMPITSPEDLPVGDIFVDKNKSKSKKIRKGTH